ncbi:MAG: Fimbrial assembly family protein [Ramlibacter sp.]|nr:Fimbrial assembly family protein [Ramlibacter sp.]
MTMSETPTLSRLHGLALVHARAGSWLSGLNAGSASFLAWVSPAESVLLFHPDGSQSVWRGSSRMPDEAKGGQSRFIAVQLPEDMVLTRSLPLPRMSQAHSAEAVELEVRSNSPFAPGELAWGSLVRELEGGQKQVDIAITSRRHVSDFIQNRWPELAAGVPAPEVWALSGQGTPVVLQGYGEARRVHRAVVERRWNWALAAAALALATLAAMTPTIQLRQRALEAADAFDAVLRRVGPLVRKRDELAALNDRVRALDVIAAGRVDPAAVMEYLTRILPDDTYLYSLDIQKTKITASGHTVDASALLQKLSSDPRLRNVKAPTAVTRLPGATKEAFVIEFTMEPKPEAVATALPGAAVAAVPVSGPVPEIVAAAASAPAGPASMAPAPQPKAPSAPAAPAAGGSPFVIGGSR